MSDRKPLTEVADKPPAVKSEPKEAGPTNQALGDQRGINEGKMYKDFSLMVGFDGRGFEGEGRKAEDILKWAKQKSELSKKTLGMEVEPLIIIKNAIKESGVSDKGKTLMEKLYRWVKIDSQIDQLRQEQALFKE